MYQINMGDAETVEKKDIDLSKPRWEQNTYMGRAKHFLLVTNPLNCLATSAQLDEAKRVVDAFKKTKKMPPGYDEDKLWKAKYLYDSAFHPDTGEKMVLVGRMAAQAPMNTLITAGMITFYKTTPATVFWQWINQTFNAVVNYTNRSGDAPIPVSTLFASYCGACGGALSTALYLNSRVKHMNPLFGRLVPFAAVAAANFINIPMMRSSEIINGTPVYTSGGERLGRSGRAALYGILLVCVSRITMATPGMSYELLDGTPVFTADGERLGVSRRAGALGIGLVIISRVVMATPGMILTPVLTNYGTKRGWFTKRPWLVLPFQLAMVGACVTFATPLACAIFQQRAAIKASALDSELQEIAKKKNVDVVYFNKGL